MNTSEYKPIQAAKHAEKLGQELERLSKSRTEQEFEGIIASDVLPELLNYDVYGDTVLNKMELVHTVYLKSIIEEKRLSVSGGVSLMNVNSLNWFIDFIHSIESYLDERESRTRLEKKVNELKNIILSEMAERSQLYEGEIKKHLNMIEVPKV